MSARPVIGVTVSRRTGWRVFPLIAFNLWLAGARALRWQALPGDAPGADVPGQEAAGRDGQAAAGQEAAGQQAAPGAREPSEAQVAPGIDLSAVDGVVIGGGDDISPMLYGGQMMARARLDPARDALEKAVLGTALSRDIPVLGICRGSQMLNIVLGGTLDQDAYATHGSRKYVTILPRKTLTVCPDTRLADIAGTAPMKVNALHSQSVRALGEGLRVVAHDEGGMIQGVERMRDPFALGVQWHPEYLFYARRQRRIFRALVLAAEARRLRHAQNARVDADLGTI